jgi:phage virion morphogenesis protein
MNEPIGPSITVTTQQLDRMREKLVAYADRLRKPKGLASGIAALMETQVRRRIQDEKTDPEGKAWDGWADSTKAQRKANNSILLFEGRLRDSIVGKALNGNTVVVGSSMVYANVHQYGWPERNIPERPYLGLSQDNEDEIIEMVLDWCDPARSL